MIAIQIGSPNTSFDRSQCAYPWFSAAYSTVRWITAALFFASLFLVVVKPSTAQDTTGVGEEWYPRILDVSQEIVLTQQARTEKPFLPDFSYAGYRWGEEPLPESAGEVVNVVDFGAAPDDGVDDTRAIQSAILEAKAIEGTVILRFPPGRYIVREILFVERGNFILRGSGSGEKGTELHFPRPMKEMRLPDGYRSPLESGMSQFSWRGGVIWTRDPSPDEPHELARLVAGRRGQHIIKTDASLGLRPGEVVQIRWYNREGRDSSLLYHVYCTLNLRFGNNLYERPERPIVTQEVTVEKVQGQAVWIKEPLLHDLRRGWEPTLHAVQFLEGIGIEHLRITFPDVSYAGHHKEAGYNGIYLTDVLHSWVRNVSIENADSGILTSSSKNFTLREIETSRSRGRGHYSIQLANVYGGLVTDFTLGSAIHNPSFNTKSRGSVYTNGFINSPKLDQHRGVNHQNLFDNLTARYYGPDDRLFDHGGSRDWAPVAGAFNTFWNIYVDFGDVPAQTDALIRQEGVDGAPHARLVGVGGSKPIAFDYSPEPYIEGSNRSNIAVPSLYEYQLQKRLSGQQSPSLAIYNPLDGYRFREGEDILIEAGVSGVFEAKEVRFMAGGEEIGTDMDGSDGWSVVWEEPPNGYHAVQAIASDAEGRTLFTRPLTCSGKQIGVWVGNARGALHGNYPNPFRDQTTIGYVLPRTQRVRIDVYDAIGRRVRTLVDEVQRSGEHEVQFETSNLASGVYFYRIGTKFFSEAGKAVVVK